MVVTRSVQERSQPLHRRTTVQIPTNDTLGEVEWARGDTSTRAAGALGNLREVEWETTGRLLSVRCKARGPPTAGGLGSSTGQAVARTQRQTQADPRRCLRAAVTCHMKECILSVEVSRTRDTQTDHVVVGSCQVKAEPRTNRYFSWQLP